MKFIDKLFPVRKIPRRLRNQFMRTRFGQRFAVSLGRDLAPERWIFIIACYNSGTTLLKKILAEHPEIGALPGEGVRFTDALPRPEEFGWNRMWCRCLQDIRLEPGAHVEDRVRRIKRQWSIAYPKDRPNLLEKSIANAARMPFLQAHFQPAYFIYLVRNGYAVAEGIRRKAAPWRWRNPVYSSQYPIELCAEQWRQTDRLVSEDRDRCERFLQVYYEDLTREPADVLKQITDFLGLRSIPDEVLQQNWETHGIEAPIRNMNEKSLAQLSAADLEKIHQVAGETLARHGYEMPKMY